MRKGIWSAAALIVLVSGAPIFWASRVQAADGQVRIVDKDSPNDVYKWRFEPAELTVAAGTKVIWTNDGAQPHTVTADDNSFDSKTLSGGATFERVFATGGQVIKYHCDPHPWMKGTIKVADSAASTPATVTTTTAPAGGATATTAAPATTTTTAKAAAGASSTTSTTAAGGAGVTTTTLAPAVTPTSAPEGAGGTTDTTAQAGAEQAAAEEHPSEGAQKKKHEKNSPVGIAFASVSTLLLAAIAGKLLASKP